MVETKGNHAWAQKLMSLNERSILWYPKKIRVRDIIVNCESFPNVPLIGSKECINYNPILAMRLLGHPIWENPKEGELEEFILHGGDTSHKELFRKVIYAWEKVHVKENKLKRRDTSSKESYTSWVKEMVHLIKLPFVIDPTYLLDIPDPIPMSTEEVDRLRETIVRLEKDKESLEHSLYDMTYKNNQVSYDLEQRDKQLLKNREELQAERSKRQKTLGGLFSTEVDFKNINKKLKETQAKGQRWKRSWDQDMWEQQER